MSEIGQVLLNNKYLQKIARNAATDSSESQSIGQIVGDKLQVLRNIDQTTLTTLQELSPDLSEFLDAVIQVVPDPNSTNSSSLKTFDDFVAFKRLVTEKFANNSGEGQSYREQMGIVAADDYQNHGIELARRTITNIIDQGLEVVTPPGSESYSAICDKSTGRVVVTVNEGLGTKNAAADKVLEQNPELGEDWYIKAAQDNAAMVINDGLTSGILPAAFNVHVDVGDESEGGFLTSPDKGLKFNEGTKAACDDAGCVYAGGETAVLKGLVEKGKAVLSGSMIGIGKGEDLIKQNLQTGDRIILVKSSGIHANGISKVRAIADRLAEGYKTDIGNGQTLAEALLTPTTIYAGLLKELKKAKVDIHYLSNITGHPYDGKIMRAPVAADYILDNMPEPQQIFKFIQEQDGMSDEQIYNDYNMGAGFAIYVPEAEVDKTLDAVKAAGLEAVNAGRVELKPDAQEKNVIIKDAKGIRGQKEIKFSKALAA